MKKYVISVILSAAFFSCKKETPTSTPTNLLYATRGTNAGIYDQQGRFMLLRGVNYNVLGDYWQANANVATQKQYSADDFKLMAKYGVNVVRLLFNWSKLEPRRGEYNQNYINEIKKAIEDAAVNNIYILLDMHQDAFSKYIVTPTTTICDFPNRGWDGAPDWATITDNASTCTVNGSRESAPAVVHAWQNFWDNTNGIQDACVGAWSDLVLQTAQYANVLGYDLINEPSLGYKGLDQETQKISIFYDKCIEAIRQAENKNGNFEHIIFFETSVTWNGKEVPFVAFPNLTNERNMVFAPHTYFEAISYVFTVEQGYDLIKTLTSIYRAKMFVGEFGYFGNPATDAAKYKRFTLKEDENFTGSTWWQWCQAPGDPHGISWNGTQYANTSMAMIELDKNGNFTGNVNDFYLKILSRTRPIAICGKPLKLSSNSDNGTMHFEAKTATKGETVLWISDAFGEPIISGNNTELMTLKKVDGGYLAFLKVTDNYKIDVGF